MTATSTIPRPPGSLWGRASVRLAIALAFADASVVVLALPQIVIRLHTTISHVSWVITAYNLALIAGTLLVRPIAARLAGRGTLIVGLALFGLASLGSGAAGSLRVLIVFRCLQGLGGAMLLCASLPLISARDDDLRLRAWAAAAAVGAAVGPAAGGVLTQLFDWRAIFYAQAPVALAAILAALASGSAGRRPDRSEAADAGSDPASPAPPPVRGTLSPGAANLALLLISAGLIGALFIATVLLINVWLLSPLGAAGILALLPLTTLITERLAARTASSAVTGRLGAVVLAVGLAGLALISHRLLVPAGLALAVCGVGLGLAFPTLTRSALATHGNALSRAARTVAAREGGLVVGLVLLTPILVSQLNAAPAKATGPITQAVIVAPISLGDKLRLGSGLQQAAARAPESRLPDVTPAFAAVAAGADPQTVRALAVLQIQVQQIIQRTVTRSFRTPLLLCAALSLLAVPALELTRRRRRR